MELKKIDLEGKGYVIGRKATAFVGALGFSHGFGHIMGSLYKACGGRKIFAPGFVIGTGFLGSWLSLNVSDITEGMIQSFAIGWNKFVDKVNETEDKNDENDILDKIFKSDDEEVPEEQTQIPESQLWPEPVGRDDMTELNDWIVKWQIFEFNDREKAENTFEFLKKHEQFFFSEHGNKTYITLRDYIQCRITCDDRFAFVITDSVLEKMKDYLDIYGWDSEQVKNAYIDPIITGSEDNSMEGIQKYILVMQDYRDLSWQYEIVK